MLQNRILTGTIVEENPTRPGTYHFKSSLGHEVHDAHLISSDADNKGGGDLYRPRPGTRCAALFSEDGGQCLIVGQIRAPFFDEDKDDQPKVGNAAENLASGDKVYKTAGGASLTLKAAGTVIVRGSKSSGYIRMLPADQTTTIRAANLTQHHDGYRGYRGRVDREGTDPATYARDDYKHESGGSHDRVRIDHGSIGGTARRQLTIGSVTVVGGQTSTVIKTRETHYSDGSWLGEGPKYYWGSKSEEEPAVLGTQLVESLQKLIGYLQQLQVNTAWGPSTPPLPVHVENLQSVSDELSGKILSTYLFFSKEPATLGTE